MRSSIPLWLAAPLCFAAGLLLLWGSVVQFRTERRFLASGVRTRGVVESFVYSHGPKGASYPVIRFTTLEGAAVSATSRSGRSGFRVGQEVAIVYNPDDPSQAIIDAWWSRWGGTGGLALFAAIFFVVGVRALLSMLGVP